MLKVVVTSSLAPFIISCMFINLLTSYNFVTGMFFRLVQYLGLKQEPSRVGAPEGGPI